MDLLVLLYEMLHGVACCVAIGHAYKRRRSEHRLDSRALAVVWLVWLVLDLARMYIATVLPAPGPEPYMGARNRTLLALDSAFYLAWPIGLAGWIRWVFIREKPFAPLVCWLLAFGLPTLFYPAIRGANWFFLAGIVHLLALSAEIGAFIKWAKRREKPLPWHGVAIASGLLCVSPVFAFFASSEQRSDYVVWVVRALVALHLGVIAFVGGDLWFKHTQKSNMLL